MRESHGVSSRIALCRTLVFESSIKMEDAKEIELSEWLEAKRDLLELTFQLKVVDRGVMTCQAKTRGIKKELHNN